MIDLLALLKRMEWNQGNDIRLCPSCGSSGRTHSQTCELESVIETMESHGQGWINIVAMTNNLDPATEFKLRYELDFRELPGKV